MLVVDDDPDVLESMVAILDDGYDVATASSATDALGMVEGAAKAGKPFHVVCSDWQMPGMDGLAFFETLKGRTHLPPVSCILISGHMRDLPMRICDADRKHLGIMRKPFSPQDFRARVEHYAHLTRMRRGIETLNKRP